jgi:hypothetical protein
MDSGNTEGLDKFQKALLDLEDALKIFKNNNSTSVEEACKILVAVSNFKTQLAMIYEDFSFYTIGMMSGSEVIILPSGVTVEKKSSKDRKGWQHKDLASVVADRIRNLSIDMDTGERVMSQEEMIVKLLDYVQPSYWRVTALSDIGVNADDFCQAGEIKETISIRRNK